MNYVNFTLKILILSQTMPTKQHKTILFTYYFKTRKINTLRDMSNSFLLTLLKDDKT